MLPGFCDLTWICSRNCSSSSVSAIMDDQQYSSPLLLAHEDDCKTLGNSCIIATRPPGARLTLAIRGTLQGNDRSPDIADAGNRVIDCALVWLHFANSALAHPRRFILHFLLRHVSEAISTQPLPGTSFRCKSPAERPVSPLGKFMQDLKCIYTMAGDPGTGADSSGGTID